MGEELLHTLEQSVLAVQQKYGFHSGLAIEEDYCVSTMCRTLECVLLHHAKFRRASFLKDTDDDVLVWDLVSRFLAKSEIVRFENEANLKSGIGRLRSWLRSALNDGLIEKYLQQIADSDVSLLRLFYDDGSVMLDKELVSSLPGILSAVSTVLFSFDLDRTAFNTPIRIDRTMSAKIVPNNVHKPLSSSGSSCSSKGKRRVKRAEILDTDVPEIVEPGEADTIPNIERLLGGTSLFGGEDVDLENLLVGLIPQHPTSGSSDEDNQLKETLTPNTDVASQEHTVSSSQEMASSPPIQLTILNEDMDLSFEVGTLPDTPTYGELNTLSNIQEDPAESDHASLCVSDSSKTETDDQLSESLDPFDMQPDSLPLEPESLPLEPESLPLEPDSLPSTESASPDNLPRQLTSTPAVCSPSTQSIQNQANYTVSNTVDNNENNVPLKENTVPLKESSVPLIESIVPLKGNTVPLKESSVPLKESSVPLKESSVPLKESSVPLKESSATLKESSVPLNESIVALNENIVSQDEKVDPVKESVLDNADRRESYVLIEQEVREEAIKDSVGVNGGENIRENENKLERGVVQELIADSISVKKEEDDPSFDPYDSEDLPRSSSVICKPYPPAVKRVMSTKSDRSSAKPVVIDAIIKLEKGNTPPKDPVKITKTSSTVNTPDTSPKSPDSSSTQATGLGSRAEAGISVPARTLPNHRVMSNSVPTTLPPTLLQRSMSIQLPERLPPLGSPVRTQFDIDFDENSDAVSICSDISSVRGYAASNRSTGDGMDSVSTLSESLGIAYTAGELRNVLTSLLQQKQDIETQNRQLQETLNREMLTRSALKEEIEHMQSTFIQRQSHDQAVIRGLQRENQMLKQQLKKYVTVVQQLRRDDRIPSDHDLSSVLVEVPVIQPLQIPAAQANVSFSNSALEHKLAQVSEMHGELMELNQELVTKNLAREKQLHEMEKKLTEIENKEATRKQRESDPKRVKSKATKPEVDFSDFQLVDSPLLQIWIPAAMIKGEGARKHHVYQIIVQVGGEQWTVYRRYAEFRSFHKLLVGKQPYFSKLELPGKTHFHRKVPSVVEDRRGKLEVYLQRVTSCLADRKQGVDSVTMDLHSSPCKASVTSAIHFLRELEEPEDVYRGF